MTDQSLGELAKAIASGDVDAIQKAITNATNLVNIDLQPVAREIYPVLTPLRNMLPRVGSSNGGTATQWRAVVGINATHVRPGVSEGNRSAVITTTVTSYIAAYKTLGLEDYVTFEADLSAEGFDDVKALAVRGLLRSLMIAEEVVILGGNATLALGTCPTPTLATAAGGGAIPDATDVHVRCVAITLEGMQTASVTAGVQLTISRTNADGSVDTFGGGASIISADTDLTTGTPGTNDNVITAYVTPVQGALGYAWYWGPNAAAGCLLGGITTINSIIIGTAAGTGTQAANATGITTDNSTDALVFDGLIYLALGAGQENPAASASGSIVSYNATGTPGVGTPLTADGAGGVVEIENDLLSFWNASKLQPTDIFVSAQQILDITKKVIAGGSAPLFRFVLDGASQNLAEGTIRAGSVIGNYLSKYSLSGGSLIRIRIHPNLPSGTMLYYSNELPYQITNVGNVAQIKTRRDYWQIQWPLRTRKYEYGVYTDEVLQHYFPPSMGVRFNIAAG
jgi:hypothetical protein